MSNILIIAGTGTMGQYLSRIIRERGHTCWVTSRNPHKNEERLYYLKGNPHDIVFLQKSLEARQWDSIIDFTYYTPTEFNKVYRHLLGNTKQYIFLSSARVYAQSSSPLTENSARLLDVCPNKDYVNSDEYAIAKAKEEDLLFSSSKNNWVIIRPYITYGSETFQLSPIRKEFWLYRALKGKTILFSKDLADRYTAFTHGEDVAHGMASLILNMEANGECFNIATEESLKWSDILSIYIKIIESTVGIKVKVKMLDNWEPILTGAIEQIKYDRLYDRCFDCSKLSKFYNPLNFRTVECGLWETLPSFLKTPTPFLIDMRYEGKVDRITREWERISSLRKRSFKDILRYYYGRFF